MAIRRKGAMRELKIVIPESVYFELERRLTNNFKEKPMYGVRSQLITAIIQRYLQETTEQGVLS